MVFGDLLNNLVGGVPGAVAALIMGYDGIPLEEYRKPDASTLDLQTLAVEYTSLINDMKKNAINLGAQGLQEISVRTDQWTIIIRLVNEEYFAILALESTAYFGKGRYLLRSTCSQVRSQL